MEHVKSTIEHLDPIIVGFFILKYAKLRMLEPYKNFFVKLCADNKFEELEWIQIFSFWRWQKKIEMNVSFPASDQNGLKSKARIVETTSTQMRKTTFLPVLAALNIRNMTRENQVQGGVQMYRNAVYL